MSDDEERPEAGDDLRPSGVVASGAKDATTGRLVPAKPDATAPPLDELGRDLDGVRPAYLPRIPWKWIVPAVALFGIVYFGYQYRERERADDMRRQILASHEQHLSSIADRYRELRGRLEGWVIEAAAAGEPERYVDPRLRISGLHGGEGLYLRLLATEASSPEAIEQGALAMSEDAITRCLGIAPASARGFYESGQFLMPQFVDEVRAETSFMRLRVIDDQLARGLSVDVPVVSTLLRSEYFLLVLQQGESRRDAPVDVYLWDLREQRQLLRTRVQGRGILLPVRLRFDGVETPQAPGHPSVTSPGAFDCSIAAQIKALTGEPPIFVGAEASDTLEQIEAADEPPPETPPIGPVGTLPEHAEQTPTE